MWVYNLHKMYEWHIVTKADLLYILHLQDRIHHLCNRYFGNGFIWNDHIDCIRCQGSFSDPIFWTVIQSTSDSFTLRVFVRGNGCEVCTVKYTYEKSHDQLTLDQITF